MKKYLLFFILNFINFAIILIFVQSISSFVLYIGIISLIYLIGKQRRNDMLLSFSIGILITLLFYFYQMSIYGNHYYLGKFSDDFVYEEQSLGFYTMYQLDVFELQEFLGILHNSIGYVYFLAIIRFFGSFFDGYHTLLPRFVNIGVIQVCAYFIYKSGVNLFNGREELMRKAAFYFAVFPSVVFISQNVFRDILVGTLMIMITYFFSYKKNRLFNFLIAIALCFILFYFRKLGLFSILLIVPLYLFDIRKIDTRLVAATFFVVFVTAFYFIDQLDSASRLLNSYDELNSERLGTLATAIFTLPKYIGIFPRLSFLILNPLPGIANLEQFYSGLSVFIQVLLYPFTLLALLDKKIDLKLKLTFLLLFIGVAFSTINFRHITMFMPFFFILTFLGFDNSKFGSQSYIRLFFLFIGYLLITLGAALIL